MSELGKMDMCGLEDIVGTVLGRLTIAAVLVLAMLGTFAPSASAVPIANDAFTRTWQRTDKPVAELVVSRTWMWGTEPFTAGGPEDYVEAPGGIREVQYFDKSRMEINHDPNVPADSPWKVTNGLLVKELMSGQMQVGDATFETREPARVNVAGDPDDASNVTYWFMGLLQDEAPVGEGTVINQILTPGAAGNLYLWSSELGGYGITAARYVPETHHTVAGPFWNFMNSWGTVYEHGAYVDAPLFENPFYATGYPLTEAYWANVKVAGIVQPVLIQCFERRCLTYTPNNDPAWRVEAGNVGQHYFKWRYASLQPDPDPVYPDTHYEWAGSMSLDAWNGDHHPVAIDADTDGSVYVSSGYTAGPYDSGHPHVLHKFSPTGSLEWSVTYSYDRNYFDDVAVKNGMVFVSAGGAQVIYGFTSDGKLLFTTDLRLCMSDDPNLCTDLGPYFLVSSIDVDSDLHIYAAGGASSRTVGVFALDGKLIAVRNFSNVGAWDIEIDPSRGESYLTDPYNDAITKLDQYGTVVETWHGFDGAYHVAMDPLTDTLFVANAFGNEIVRVTRGGSVLTRWGSSGSDPGQFNRPGGITTDSLGNVYVVDIFNNRVQKFAPASQ